MSSSILGRLSHVGLLHNEVGFFIHRFENILGTMPVEEEIERLKNSCGGRFFSFKPFSARIRGTEYVQNFFPSMGNLQACFAKRQELRRNGILIIVAWKKARSTWIFRDIRPASIVRERPRRPKEGRV